MASTVLQQEKQFKQLILILGGFHMDKASLHCIGRNFRTSGLVYNEIPGIKNVEEVAKGTHCMSIL